jgi:GPH family glycoside/pentoside/hexuronide:cation symporter
MSQKPSNTDASTATRVAYGIVALPIAIAGLPIYLQMPQFYAEMTGMSLATLGVALLLARLIDTVQDPIIGSLSDRANARGMPRVRQMRLALPFFLMGFVALVMPTPEIATAWLAVSLVILYTSFSILSVNYYAIGTQLVHGEKAQNRLSSWREAMVIVGILIGSVVPQLLVNHYGKAYGYMLFAIGLGVVCMLLIPRLLKYLQPIIEANGPQHVSASDASHASPWKAMRDSWAHKRVRTLLIAYFVNGLANAFPATLILFYVADVLGAEEQAGYLLGVYFAAGIACMPLWAWLSGKIGAARSWVISMLVAGIVFAPSALLGQGDVQLFYVICALSGACLGADMAMPPSLLSQAISENSAHAGGFFGVYNLLFKLALAFAAGIGLPLLAAFGYVPGDSTQNASAALAWLYGAVPAFLKLSTALLAWVVLTPKHHQ